ncbi:Cys-tRNA(Pro) deacylase [Paramicrobacterium agarici]|uniref:Cys-tRNA(Pro)/Cys-tRNA(Cys) deacylase n=1 Tax=Paramicrobacterium agarici TaxID=630514 RepID=A0A2A9E001_9MICO|nr:Cys-tRNA(Pro) deacylase [Microbacterium agarici]PFG31500.1 Cys-tRNA(Pro)/Cys-tRNA(Cys) deacylase [Microbacterium agarici]TQO21388.1 Cys-tRNA(Pro)/Cys-tRNA(Cys) deacylase [Microbacterium agarici]
MARSHETARTPATRALTVAEVPFTLHRYEHDPRATDFGAEAAEKLDVAPERIFKTLVVDAGGGLAVAVIPVHSRMRLAAVASALAVKKARLADPAVAERKTGYVVGGISPVGQKTHLPTVIDSSSLAHETIFVSAGRRGLDLEIAPRLLVAVTRGDTAPLT